MYFYLSKVLNDSFVKTCFTFTVWYYYFCLNRWSECFLHLWIQCYLKCIMCDCCSVWGWHLWAGGELSELSCRLWRLPHVHQCQSGHRASCYPLQQWLHSNHSGQSVQHTVTSAHTHRHRQCFMRWCLFKFPACSGFSTRNRRCFGMKAGSSTTRT